MRTITADLRNEFLSGTVTPEAEVTIRRLRLDFGATLHSLNDGAVLDGANLAGDDYFDPSYHKVLWGDSVVGAVDPWPIVRVVSRQAWGGTAGLYASRFGSVWTMSALPATGQPTLGNYVRPGLYARTDTGSDEKYYFWYLDNGYDLSRIELDYSSGWTWGSSLTPLEMGSIAAGAIHPISLNEAIVVSYEDPYMMARYTKYDGGWTYSDWWILAGSDEMLWSDAHWSDAVELPGDSSKVVIAVNLTQWGTAHTIIYDKVSEIFSQNYGLLPSAEQWGSLRAWVSGLSVVDDKVWAVVTRDPVASGDMQTAHHVALAHSVDGINWTDSDFISLSCLRGKFLYREDDDDDYCYVVGNASVARGEATNKIGHDADALKYEFDEVSNLSLSVQGPSSAHQVSISGINEDDAVTDSGLLEVGNEIEIKIGTATYSPELYAKALITMPQHTRDHTGGKFAITGHGYMSRMAGEMSHRPVSAKMFEGPYSDYSIFQHDGGSARLTFRQTCGEWILARRHDVWHNILHCRKAGIALLPRGFRTLSFQARTAIMPLVAVEGDGFVFFYEDDANYWRAGVYNTGSEHRLVIDRYVSGVRDNKAYATISGGVDLDAWFTLFLDVRPGRVYAYVNSSDSFDYSSPTASVSYDLTLESEAPPIPHHVGVFVEKFDGWEGAEQTGDVSSAASKTLVDTGASFPSTLVGMYVLCKNQSRRIIDTNDTDDTLWLEPPWASVPEADEEYGIYQADRRDGPAAYFRDFWVCEGRIQPSVDEMVDGIMALAGVERDEVFTDSDIPTLSSSSPTMRDVDLVWTGTEAEPVRFYFWLSNSDSTGEYAYSGDIVEVYEDYTKLIVVEGLGSESSPYQSSTTTAVHRNMIEVPSGVSREVRLQASKNAIIVSCDGHFVTAFPVETRWIGGYVAKENGTVTRREFPSLGQESFSWDTNEPAASAMENLMRGRRAKMIERADGSVAVSRFDTQLGNLGTYDEPVTRLGRVGNIRDLTSLIEMVGAYDTMFFIDAELARKALRFARVDNPTVETQEQGLIEAKKLVDLGKARLESGKIFLYAPDPALELEDLFATDTP